MAISGKGRHRQSWKINTGGMQNQGICFLMIKFTCSFFLWYSSAGLDLMDMNGFCVGQHNTKILWCLISEDNIIWQNKALVMHLWLERSISFQPTEDQKGKCHCWVVAMRRSCLLVIVGNVIGNAPYIRYLEVGVIRPRCGIFHETKGRAFQPSECYCNSRRANKSSDGFLLDPLPEQHSTLHRWTSSPPKHSPDWAEGQCTLVLLLLFHFFLRAVSQSIFLKGNTTYYESHRDFKKYSCRLKFSALPLSVYLMILANSKEMDKIHKQDSLKKSVILLWIFTRKSSKQICSAV